MRDFDDADGTAWTATAHEEATPRHHGRWVLVFHPVDDAADAHPMPEVRWQTRPTAERTLRTMSDFELRKRLDVVRKRRAAATPET